MLKKMRELKKKNVQSPYKNKRYNASRSKKIYIYIYLQKGWHMKNMNMKFKMK